MVMIGHKGHPETIGTMGQLPKGEVLLVETPEDVSRIIPRNDEKLAYITQTTLSVDDTIEIVKKAQRTFSKNYWPPQRRHLLRNNKSPRSSQGSLSKS